MDASDPIRPSKTLAARGPSTYGSRTEIVDVYPGVCLTLPLGVHFQFRTFGFEPLAAIGITMPPWPGEGEALVVAGEWQPTAP